MILLLLHNNVLVFCNNSGRDHEEAIKRIYHYLLKTRYQGPTLRQDKTKGLKCFVDVYWAGSWTQSSSHEYIYTHSRTRFIITYSCCSIF